MPVLRPRAAELTLVRRAARPDLPAVRSIGRECWPARPAGGDTFLARLYVDPTAQGHGVGHRLLDGIIRTATGSVALTVLSTNERARSFYEQHGFRADGREPDQDGGPDQLRMIRRSD